MQASPDFKARLRDDLPTWLADGILTPGAARALTARYDLEATPKGTPASRGSGPIAAVGAIAMAGAVALAFADHGLRDGSILPLASLGACFAAAPLVLRGEGLAAIAAAMRVVGRAVFYLVAFGLSFVSVAEALRMQPGATPALTASLPCLLLALVAAAIGLRRADVDAHTRGEAMLLAAAAVAFAAGLFLETGAGAAVVANLSLAFLAAGRLVRGMSWHARGAFYEGLVVAAAVAACRIAEVPLAGWPRASGVFLAGIAAVAAGVCFERRRARASAAIAERGEAAGRAADAAGAP